MSEARVPRPSDKQHGAHTLRVECGVVVGIYGDDVFVELGPRRQGVISRHDFPEDPTVGEFHEFTLRGQEESLWILSLPDAEALSTWEDMEVGSLVHARSVRERHGGLEMKVGPLHAFLPRSHTGLPREQKPEILVGKTLTCEVLEVDPERQRVLLSRKLVLQREKASGHQREIAHLKPGDVVQGRVSRIEEYGVFLRFGRGLEGLVHVSNLSWERVHDPRESFEKGASHAAKVLYIRNQGKRIGLGIKQLEGSPWDDVHARFEEDQIVEGRVERVVDFGAFVSVATGIEGLVHRSETWLCPDQRVNSLFQEGQELSVRVCEIDSHAERMALSLLHRSGARIKPGEAQALREHRERGEDHDRPSLGTRFGDLLRGAMGEAPPPVQPE